MFACISVLWCQSENCFKLRQQFLDAANLDRKYRNDWSFCSENMKHLVWWLVWFEGASTELFTRNRCWEVCWSWFVAWWVADTVLASSEQPSIKLLLLTLILHMFFRSYAGSLFVLVGKVSCQCLTFFWREAIRWLLGLRALLTLMLSPLKPYIKSHGFFWLLCFFLRCRCLIISIIGQQLFLWKRAPVVRGAEASVPDVEMGGLGSRIFVGIA